MSPARTRRLLLVSHHWNNRDSGAQRVYFELLDAVRQAPGWDADMLHLEDHLPTRNPVVVKSAQRFALPQVISRSVARHDPGEYDVVMASSGMTYPLFRRLRRDQDRPLLVNHVHGLYRYDDLANRTEARLAHWPTSLGYRAVTGPGQVRWDARGNEEADLVVVQNYRDLGEVRRTREAADVAVIPPALYPELDLASRQPVAPMRDRVNRLLWFGTWESRKGAFYVPDAFRLLREEHPHLRLTVGGTGQDAAAVLAHFDPADRDAVTVLGRVSVEEHVALMREHGVMLFPSVSEGFGLAALEGAAFAMAPVVTGTGIGADHFRDGISAQVTVPSSWHIARAVGELGADPDRAHRIGQNAQAVARGFTVAAMTQAYLDLFATRTKLVIPQQRTKAPALPTPTLPVVPVPVTTAARNELLPEAG